MVSIVAILHHSVSYVRSVSFEIIEKYKEFYKLVTLVFYFMIIQMTAVIHDVGVAAAVVWCRRS